MSRWFRVDDDVVNDPKVQSLSDALFRAWVNVLCVASKHGGKLPALSAAAFILHVSESKAAAILTQLHGVGLLDKDGQTFAPHNWGKRQFQSDDNDPSAASRAKRYRDRKRDATVTVTRDASRDASVTHERPHTDTQTDYPEANASGALAPVDPSIPEREFFSRGKEVLGKSAGGQLANLLRAKGGNVALARSALETASTKQNPGEYVAASIRTPIAKPLTPYQQEKSETKDVLAKLGAIANGHGGGQTLDRVLPLDPSGKPGNLRGGTGSDVCLLPRALGSGSDRSS